MEGPTVKPYRMTYIKSKLLQPALTSHFICGFTPPSSVNKENPKKPSAFADFMKKRSGVGFGGAVYTDNQELIELSCSEASLPGSSLATNEINNDYTGVTERHAYRRLYDDRADFTFYVDSNYYIIDYFENWIAFISGEDDLKTQGGRTFNHRVKFPNDYKTDSLYITKFERDHDREDRKIPLNRRRRDGKGRALTYKFINAYPISITSMPVSYDSSQLLKCTVSFTYSRYIISRTGNFASQNEEPRQPGSLTQEQFLKELEEIQALGRRQPGSLTQEQFLKELEEIQAL